MSLSSLESGRNLPAPESPSAEIQGRVTSRDSVVFGGRLSRPQHLELLSQLERCCSRYGRNCSMRASIVLPLAMLALAGCVSVERSPPPTTTVVAPAPAPVDTTTTTIRR